MTEAVQEKKSRGNPNWKKKIENLVDQVKTSPKVDNDVSANPQSFAVKFNEHDVMPKNRLELPVKSHDIPGVWLKCYTALIGTYNTPGPAVIKAAAANADLALLEYQSRFNK